METCCSIKFNNRRDLVIEEMKKEMGNLAKTEADIFPDSKIGNWMKLIWDLMEKPETSVASRIMNFISISMILLSTMGMCLNTISIVAGNKINQSQSSCCLHTVFKTQKCWDFFNNQPYTYILYTTWHSGNQPHTK